MFIRYSANGCVLSTVDLRDFLKDQGEDASLIHAQSLILTYELNEWGMLLSNNRLQSNIYMVCVQLNSSDKIIRRQTQPV